MHALEALKSRRSVRVYENRPIPRETLADIIDCARLAPTGMNEQPWEFIIITNRQMLARLGALITHQKGLAEVPAAIAVVCRDTRFYVEDGSAATVSILIAAQAHGLGSCWVSGDKQPYADEVLKLLGGRPGAQKFFSLVTLGKPAENPAKEKRPLGSVMHWEKL